jgi:hypothetical protein
MAGLVTTDDAKVNWYPITLKEKSSAVKVDRHNAVQEVRKEDDGPAPESIEDDIIAQSAPKKVKKAKKPLLAIQNRPHPVENPEPVAAPPEAAPAVAPEAAVTEDSREVALSLVRALPDEDVDRIRRFIEKVLKRNGEK